MHKLVKAHPGKRTLAAIIDFLIACFIGLGFFAIAQTCFMSSKTGKQLGANLRDYQISSGLYYEDERGDMAVYEDFSNYERYEQIMTNYYLVYLPSVDSNIKHDNYWYNIFVLGLADEKNVYSKEELNTIQEPSKDCVLWEYQNVGGVKNYDLIGVPASSLYVDGNLTNEAKTKLLKFYCTSDARSVYYNAVQDLFHQSFFEETFNKHTSYNLIFPLAIAIPLALLAVYTIVPLCFRNGETAAKKMFNLCLVNNLGFKVRKTQIVLRSLPPILLVVIMVMFLPIRWTIMIMSLIMFASYLCAMLTKEKQAIHDMIAGTIVLNEKESVFYDDLTSQEVGERLYAERMAHAEEEIARGKQALEEEEKNKWKSFKE